MRVIAHRRGHSTKGREAFYGKEAIAQTRSGHSPPPYDEQTMKL